MSSSKCTIAIVMPAYNPSLEDYERLMSYASQADFCIVQDDSESSNENLFLSCFSNRSISVFYRWNGRNLGLVRSLNRGFAAAISMGADWVLVMNPDGIMAGNAIASYRRYIDNHEISSIAALFPTYDTERRPRKAALGVREVTYGDLSGTLFRSAVLKRIGLYDEKTYFYGCDVEWCLRARKAGYKFMEISEALIHHQPASTRRLKVFGRTIFSYGIDSPIRYYYQFRSGYYIHSLYHDVRQDAFMLFKLLKVIFLFDNKREYLRLHKKAKEDFLAGYFGSYDARQQNKTC